MQKIKFAFVSFQTVIVFLGRRRNTRYLRIVCKIRYFNNCSN
nr:MAG TPA: hypothetical protein [Caudoviricetes sp.]